MRFILGDGWRQNSILCNGIARKESAEDAKVFIAPRGALELTRKEVLGAAGQGASACERGCGNGVVDFELGEECDEESACCDGCRRVVGVSCGECYDAAGATPCLWTTAVCIGIDGA